MTDRRKFMKLIGLGAASAPMAANEVFSADTLAGLKLEGASSHGIDDAVEELVHAGPQEKVKISKASEYLQQFGKLPEHVEERMRDSARHVRYIDYDIAIKCWSLSVKIQTQRERNYQRELLRYRSGSAYDVAQKAFEATTGFKWPW